jgi:anion-transporting  ArsA/GET3 family ATPase
VSNPDEPPAPTPAPPSGAVGGQPTPAAPEMQASQVPMARSVVELLLERTIIVCCGSGGVGKTTTAAALALAAAEAGRRACVVTIDPARRLANALGVSELTNRPSTIAGPWRGSLSAVMLDAKSTFDDLVTQYSENEEQVERILRNRLYRNLTSALSGTHEYMAAEKLYELHTGGDFDLVVVDTPPTRNALDFVDAPGRLTRFLDNRIFRILLVPTRAYLRAVSAATRTLLKAVAKVAGSEIVEDAIAFFQAFEGMEEGFRARAAHVEQLLADGGTAFVLVAAPRRDSVAEATHFAARLAESSIPVQALIVNRVHPRFGAVASAAGADAPAGGGGGAGGDGQAGEAWRQLTHNLADFQAIAEREEAYFAELVERVQPAPVARVPFLSGDVHDLRGLDEVVRYLVS